MLTANPAIQFFFGHVDAETLADSLTAVVDGAFAQPDLQHLTLVLPLLLYPAFTLVMAVELGDRVVLVGRHGGSRIVAEKVLCALHIVCLAEVLLVSMTRKVDRLIQYDNCKGTYFSKWEGGREY